MAVNISINFDTRQFNQKVDQIQARTAKLESTFSSLALGAGAAFAGLGAGIGLAVGEAVKIEQIQTRFEVLTGSVDTATQAVKELQDFSARTPFQFEEIARAGAQLLSFGFEAEEVTARLQEIGDVAAASGTDIGDLTLIFGQVEAAGKLTGERLLQLQERAIPIGPAIAKSLGVAESQVRDLVSAGKVTDEVFKEAFATLSKEGGAAFGGIAKQSQTLGGQLSTLRDNFSLVAAQIGEVLVPAVSVFTQSLTSLFQFIRENPALTEFIAIAAAAATAFAGLVASIATAVVAWGKLTAAIAVAKAAFAAISITIGAIPIAIAAVVTALVLLALNWEKVTAKIAELAGELKEFLIDNFGVIGEFIVSRFELIANTAEAAFSAITDFVSQFFDDTEALADEAEGNEDARAQRALERERKKNEAILAQRRELLERITGLDAEFDALDEERKLQIVEENQQALEAGLLNERTARQKVNEEITKDLIKEQNQRLKDEQKFGAAVAQSRALIRSAEFQATKGALGNLASLQKTNSKELFEVGKAASIAQATINTFEGATKAIAQGGLFGPILAATVVAAGLAQIANISATKFTAAQDGGLLTGGVPGRDSIPVLGAPGELIVPERNFDEVVGAVAAQRGFGGDDTTDPAPQEVNITLGLRDGLFDVIETELDQRARLGVSVVPV